MTAGELTPIVRLAPAKLNITLSIVGTRSDGFHALHTVMVPQPGVFGPDRGIIKAG